MASIFDVLFSNRQARAIKRAAASKKRKPVTTPVVGKKKTTKGIMKSLFNKSERELNRLGQ